jgi:uncharacterized membrane protein YeaQ/YmgE (transglycosylase-associated protein family)
VIVDHRVDFTRSHRRFHRQQDRQQSGEGVFLDIVLGIVGAIVGGFIFSAFGASGVTSFNLYSMIVAIIGAIFVLLIYHAVFGRKVT